ncbi:MAG: AAA family ATPase [Planctomycetota bacterium]
MTRWEQARQLLGLGRRDRGTGRHGQLGQQQPEAHQDVWLRRLSDEAGPPRGAGPNSSPAPARDEESYSASGHSRAAGSAQRRARSLCIASGKGGTGKSSISATMATLFARRGPTLLMDGDLGCANAHILQDAKPKHSFADVISGEVGVPEIVTSCRNGVDLLAGGSGLARLAGLKTFELEMIGRGLERLEPLYQHLVIDSAAGLSRQTVAFAVACDATVVVTTPDVTAMTDAYAFLKVFVRQCEAQGIDRPMPYLVVNRATSVAEAEGVARRLEEVVHKFLGRKIELIGVLPEDRAVFRASQRRRSVVEAEPESEISRALQTLSNSILSRMSRVEGTKARRRGVGRALAEGATGKIA